MVSEYDVVPFQSGSQIAAYKTKLHAQSQAQAAPRADDGATRVTQEMM